MSRAVLDGLGVDLLVRSAAEAWEPLALPAALPQTVLPLWHWPALFGARY